MSRPQRCRLALVPLFGALACYSTPDPPQVGEETGTGSTGGATSPMTMTSTTMSMTSADTSDSSAGPGTTQTTTSVDDTGSESSSESDATETATASTGTPGCDVFADDCPGGMLCDGENCVDPPTGAVAVPGGAFMMGCNEAADVACEDDEYPYHEVTLSSYAIDATEVTYGAWQDCVAAGACAGLPAIDGGGNACNFPNPELPATCLDWAQAVGFCTWRGGVLPTEAQWEKAARSNDGRVYPWGDDAPTCTLVNSNLCGDGSLPVGSKPAGASPYGALDMSGNVFEWVADWYSPSYYVSSPDENPTGPANGSRRMIRSTGPNYVAARASTRPPDYDAPTPTSTHVNVGLRCAYPSPTP